MKRSKFNEAQIAFILRQAEDGTPIGAEAACCRPVSGQSHAPGCSATKALRPARKRELVDEMRQGWKVSIRRACAVLGARRSSYHYRHRRCAQADLNARIKEIAQTRVRYGYRRIHVLLQREGWQVKAKLREDRTVAMRRNEIWAMDFVHDQLATGRKLRILTVVDLFSRFSPAIDPAFNYRGGDVVETLERICREKGALLHPQHQVFRHIKSEFHARLGCFGSFNKRRLRLLGKLHRRNVPFLSVARHLFG
jgi:putative transposase